MELELSHEQINEEFGTENYMYTALVVHIGITFLHSVNLRPAVKYMTCRFACEQAACFLRSVDTACLSGLEHRLLHSEGG